MANAMHSRYVGRVNTQSCTRDVCCCAAITDTFSPHTARKFSLQGFPVMLSTVNGIGADANRCKDTTHAASESSARF